MRLRRLGIVLPLLLLVVAGQVFGQRRVQEYTPPYEVTDKDLNPLYGRYEIYEVDRYRGGITTEAEAQARGGAGTDCDGHSVSSSWGPDRGSALQRVVLSASNRDIMCRKRAHRWSSHYYGFQGQAPGHAFYGDEVIKVYKPGGGGPWVNLEPIGTNELWVRLSGWYYKARKTDRPVLSAGHADYCQVMGPCSAGQGDCGSDSECQSELTCKANAGASYGLAADVGVCVADDHGNSPGSAALDGQ